MIDLSLVPDNRAIRIGSAFTVDVILSGPNNINAAQVNIGYDSERLAVVGVFYAGSPFVTIVQESHVPGLLKMARSVAFNTSITGTNKFATITFQAIKSGEGFVDFAPGCKVSDADTEEDVMGAAFPGSYSVMGSATLDLSITTAEKIRVALHPMTNGGKPVEIDGPPRWGVLSGGATVAPAADGMSAYLISGDGPGDTFVLVSADADLGAGVEDLSGIVRLRVSGVNSEALGLLVSDPIPK